MASMSLASPPVTSLRILIASLAAVGGVEIGGELDLRVALQRRVRRHALVDLDRHLRLLHGLVEIGERQQRQRMVGLQIQRELQIDQRQILAAARVSAALMPQQRLGGAGLRHESTSGGSFLPALVSRRAFQHQRMPRQLLVERLVDRGARQPASLLRDDQRAYSSTTRSMESSSL